MPYSRPTASICFCSAPSRSNCAICFSAHIRRKSSNSLPEASGLAAKWISFCTIIFLGYPKLSIKLASLVCNSPARVKLPLLIAVPFCGKILAILPFFTSISSSWKGTVCATFRACSVVRVVKSIKLPPVALARYCIFGVLATAEALTTVTGVLACFTTSFTEKISLPKLKIPSLKRSNSSALRLKLIALPSVAPS